MKAVADEENRPRQAIRSEPQVQRALKEHALKVTRLREHQRLVVLEVTVELDNLRRCLYMLGEVGHIGDLVKRLFVLFEGSL